MKTLLCAALAALSFGALAQQAAPVPVEAFFERPALQSIAISPTARHVAMTTLSKEGHWQLVVLNTADMSAKVVASFRDADVVNVHWASDKRLVFGSADPEMQISDLIASSGLYAVDADGGDFRQLANVAWNRVQNDSRRQLLDPTTRFLSTTWNADSDSIFVTEAKFKATGEFDALNVLKLDTRTGASSTFQRPGETREWTIDPHDVPRVAVTKEQANRYAIQYLEPGSDTWAKLIEYEPLAPENGAFDPIGFAADGTLLVSHRRPGQGTMSLYTYDLKARKLSADPVFSVRGFDVHPLPIITREGLIGYRYLADAQSTYWTDPHMKEVQARIDKVLTGTVNILYVPERAEAPFVAVGAYSDTEPGQYFLYDMKQDKLVRLGRSHPAIDARQMSPRELVRIKARDGLDIPVWVTAPKGEKQARPMVVLVHGGPWVRGSSWRWDPESEFLASRGYVVIEPEFRGSTGYGYALFRAGWKQWGLGMQNDVADAARWAIDKGIADPKRICIMGASYGGYATLMGLVNDPELFRCGIDLAGVTDIGLMYSITWSDANDEIKTYGMPRLIGDPVKDADQLKKTSPVAQASRIKQPLLLAYGAQDRRVPIDHGKAFRDAVSATNNQVEWVVYPDEGHGLFLTKDRVDFYTRVEKFLARNIGDK